MIGIFVSAHVMFVLAIKVKCELCWSPLGYTIPCIARSLLSYVVRAAGSLFTVLLHCCLFGGHRELLLRTSLFYTIYKYIQGELEVVTGRATGPALSHSFGSSW